MDADTFPRVPSADPRDYVTDEETRALTQPRPLRVALDLALVWVWILGSIAVWGYTRHPVALIAAFIVIAARQHALNNWVHEAAHVSLTRNKKLNDWISDIFAATPHFILTADYRAKHILHHTDLGHPEKDCEIKARFLIRGWRFWKRGLVTLLGASALLTMNTYTGKTPSSANWHSRLRYYGLMAVTNGMIVAWGWFWGVPFAWVYLWALPLVTLTSFLATIRVIAEHQSHEYALEGIEQFDEQLEPAITRTIMTDPLTAFLFAPVKFNFHFEHHTWPRIPYTSLPRLCRLLKERGFYRDNPQFYGKSYYQVLADLIFPDKRIKGGHPAPT